MSEQLYDLRVQPGSRVLIIGKQTAFAGRRGTIHLTFLDGAIIQLDPAPGDRAPPRPLLFSWAFIVELEAPPAPPREPVW